MPALKTVILFDRYSIPISMSRAVVDTDIQLHEYHKEDGCRTCRKTLCSGCGRELTAEDIAKGYEYDDNCLVLFDRNDLKQIKIDSENCIRALYSTSPDFIPPIYFSTSYFAVPEPGSEAVFEMFRLSMLEEQKILIGRSVTGGLDALAAIIPIDDGFIVSKLHPDSEINKTRKSYKKPAVSPGEFESVRELLSDMYAVFDASVYENEYQNNLRGLITSKIEEQKSALNTGA